MMNTKEMTHCHCVTNHKVSTTVDIPEIPPTKEERPGAQEQKNDREEIVDNVKAPL